jgi:hypothetical protein
MASYDVVSIIKSGAPVSVAASQTNSVVSEVVQLSTTTARALVVELNLSAITVAAAVTAKIQHSMDGTTFADVGTPGNLALTTTGLKYIDLLDTLAADAAVMPVRPYMRVVITTGAGDSVTVSNIKYASSL